MNTGRLYEFLVLSKLLNFSKAADALYISQSVLTRHMQDLEKELGVPLFVRSNNRLRLNDYGEFYLNHLEQILSDLNRVNMEVRSVRTKACGEGTVISCAELSEKDS